MAMIELLQSPAVKVLGITIVSGNAWEPEEVAHTLRMLELIHRVDVPVVAGAVFPLLRTETEAMQESVHDGSFPWYGAWGDMAKRSSAQSYHAPFVMPLLPRATQQQSRSTKTRRTSSFARYVHIRTR